MLSTRDAHAKFTKLFANEDNWERLREMVDVESPDLRKQGQLYKELKKMFPDKNYTKYNKEEKERLKDWKTKLTKEELEQHNEDVNQQEQVSRLQYIAPKKPGDRPHFKGQVKRGKDGHIMLRERIEPFWVYDNFDPRFVDLVKRANG